MSDPDPGPSSTSPEGSEASESPGAVSGNAASLYVWLVLNGKSYFGGLFCGFVFGIFGAVGCYQYARERETKRGSVHGFFLGLLLLIGVAVWSATAGA